MENVLVSPKVGLNPKQEKDMPGKFVNHVPRLLKEQGFTDPTEATRELMYGIRVAFQTAVDWANPNNAATAEDWEDTATAPNAFYQRILAKLCDYFGVSVGDIVEYVPDE